MLSTVMSAIIIISDGHPMIIQATGGGDGDGVGGHDVVVVVPLFQGQIHSLVADSVRQAS